MFYFIKININVFSTSFSMVNHCPIDTNTTRVFQGHQRTLLIFDFISLLFQLGSNLNNMLNYFKRLPGRKVHCLRQEVKLTVNGGGIQNRKTYIMQSDDFPQSSMSTLYCIRNSHTSLVMPSSPAVCIFFTSHLHISPTQHASPHYCS